MPQAENGMSILVMCYNNDRHLYFCLDSIQKQQGISEIPCEVLVVCNGDVHEEALIAQSTWRLEHVPIRIVADKSDEEASLKLHGFKQSRYSCIAFLDDDMMISPDWITLAYSFMQNNPSCGICGGENQLHFMIEPMKDFSNFLPMLSVGKQGIMEIDDITESRGYVWGNGMVVRREIVEKLQKKGYGKVCRRLSYASSTDEGAELCWMARVAGYRIVYVEKLKTSQNLLPYMTSFVYLQSLSRKNGIAEQWLALYKKFQVQAFSNSFSSLLLLKIYLKSVFHFIQSGLLYLIKMEKKTSSKNYLRVQYHLGILNNFGLSNLKQNAPVLRMMRNCIPSRGSKSIQTENKSMLLLI